MPRQPPHWGHHGLQKVTNASEAKRGAQSRQRATSERLGGGWQDSHRHSGKPCGSHHRKPPHEHGFSGSEAGPEVFGAIFISNFPLIEFNKFIFYFCPDVLKSGF